MIKIKLSRVLGDQRMTQAELARKTQIRTAAINDLYHDFAERVSLTQLSNICYVLNCDLTDILEYTRDKELILEEKKPRKKKKKTTQPKLSAYYNVSNPNQCVVENAPYPATVYQSGSMTPNGTTNLTTRQYSARLTSETTLQCDGAVEWQLIEYN